jgi:hypothetical protein
MLLAGVRLYDALAQLQSSHKATVAAPNAQRFGISGGLPSGAGAVASGSEQPDRYLS